MTSNTPNRTASPAAAALATLLLSIDAIGVAALCASLFPTHLPAPRDVQPVNVVLDNQTVILAMRLSLVTAALVLIVGGAFVVRSTFARMKNGDWLRRAGPFEVSEAAVTALEDEVHFWRSAARDCYEQLDRLSELEDETDRLNRTAISNDDYDKL